MHTKLRHLATILAFLSLIPSEAIATHDGGWVTSLLAISGDHSVVVVRYSNVNYEEDDWVDVYALGHSAPLERFQCDDELPWRDLEACFEALPGHFDDLSDDLRVRFDLLPAPDSNSDCNANGTYCVHITEAFEGTAPGDWEEGEDDVDRIAVFATLVSNDGKRTVLAETHFRRSCYADPGDYARATWIDSDTVVLHGSLYAEEPCQWGTYRALFALADISDLTSVPVECGPTWVGDLLLSSQADLDAFEERGFNCVSGDMTVTSDELTKLDALGELIAVGGDLAITGSGSLESLFGLDALRVVGGDFAVRYNEALEGLEGLQNLVEVGGDVWIAWNPALEQLDGFESLSTVGRERRVVGNPRLKARPSD